MSAVTVRELLRSTAAILDKVKAEAASCMKAATRDWIAKAEADYLAAVDLARRRKQFFHGDTLLLPGH